MGRQGYAEVMRRVTTSLIVAGLFTLVLSGGDVGRGRALAQTGEVRPADRVAIRVDANTIKGPMTPMWAFFGYDEPNYTYTMNGQRLLEELALASPVPVFVRTHNLLTSGDGTPALKWGSTNAYTEDAAGNPKYDWTIVDRIVDTYVQRKMKPLMEIGFMPEGSLDEAAAVQARVGAGSRIRPHLHRVGVPAEGLRQMGTARLRVGPSQRRAIREERSRELVVGGLERARHRLLAGDAGGVPEAVRLRGGWPQACAADGADRRTARDRSQRCEDAAAAARFHRTLSPRHELRDRKDRLAPRLRRIPRQRRAPSGGRSRPHGDCQPAASDLERVRDCRVVSGAPEHADRHRRVGSGGLRRLLGPDESGERLSQRHGVFELHRRTDRAHLRARRPPRVNLLGSVTWAFEFEGQPYFAGFRDLATNGIDKPVLNVFRMLGKMRGNRVAVHSDRAAPLESIRESGVRDRPDVNALASRDGRNVAVLVWNYHDDDLPAAPAEVTLTIEGMADGTPTLTHARVDHDHSNAYEAWKKMGSPQTLSAEQRTALEFMGKLQVLKAPGQVSVDHGRLTLTFTLPRQGVSLLELKY